jgi:two-component system chemotaxis response regulator CheY
MKVLIVDDSGVMRKIISRELIALNIAEGNIFEANDGLDAIKQMENSQFDVVLLDWNMPNMLGIDVLKTMRSKGIKSAVMMITTESERANVIQAIQAGANNYLAKPFTKEDFQAKFNQMLGVPAS